MVKSVVEKKVAYIYIYTPILHYMPKISKH